ncbi:MAG: hypothetical protein LIP18_07635 [Planctomycetes bacterium]|nr:hypothetical protein [Planctomycetota bacterium]MCD7895931.1 hypothetical protein [Planctomycetaceae bacterium]
MRRSRRRLFRYAAVSVLVAVTALATSAAESLRATDEPIKITPPEPHPWWPSRYATPLWAAIENGRPKDVVELSFATRSLRQLHTVRVPDSGRRRVELTAISHDLADFTSIVDGLADSAWVTPSRMFHGGDSEDRAWVVALDGTLYRDLIGLDPDIAVNDGRSPVTANSIPSDAMPSRWQGYAGFFGTVLATPASIRTMNADQRVALGRAILWQGVRLWVVGDAADVLPELGLTAAVNASADLGRGVRRHRFGNGAVLTLADGAAETFLEMVSRSGPHDVLSAFYSGSNLPGFSRLTDGLQGVSTVFVLTALLVMGLVLGPVNYWYVRRRKNPLLFFILTPVTAVVGGAAILIGSAVVEGGGGRYNEHAVLIARSGGDDAFLLDFRLARPGFWLPDVRFPAETLVVPAGSRSSGVVRVVDWTDGLRLGPGWFQSRAVNAYLTARPVVARLAVAVRRDKDDWRIRNDLDHDIVSGRLYTGGDGRVLRFGPVPAGGEVVLRDGDTAGAVPDRNDVYRVLTTVGFSGDRSRVRLVAECDGVPYLNDGGFGGRRINGRYYYVLLDETLEADND